MLGLTAKLLLLCPSTEEVRRSKAVGDAPRGPSRFRKLADAPDGSGPCLLWVQKRTLEHVPQKRTLELNREMSALCQKMG